MNKYSNLLLKICIIIILLPVMTVSVIGIIGLFRNPVNPIYAHLLYPIVIGTYVSSIPFYYCLYLAYKMLDYIDQGRAFSTLSTKALDHIKLASFSFSIIYIILLPFVYFLAQKDDAPGLVIMGIVPIFGAFIIGVFSAVLQHILADAIAIKSENDLTV